MNPHPVVIQGLGVSYGPRQIFAGVDLELRAARFMALIGPNGSGKSSLLRVLAGTQQPTSGAIARRGRVSLIAPVGLPPGDLTPLDLASYSLATRRPFWQWALPAVHEQRIREALARCELADRAHDAMRNLSAGEVQRAWIAAALVSDPDVLLVDEPTTHLDVRFQLEVLSTLSAVARSGVSVVTAIHDLTLAARFADDITLLAGGLAQSGPPDEILEAGALSRAFEINVTTHRHPELGYLICLPS